MFQTTQSGQFVAAKFRGTLNRALSGWQDVNTLGMNRPGTVTIGQAGGPVLAAGAMFEFDGYCAPGGARAQLWYRVAASSFPRTAGWSSENGFRGPETSIQIGVLGLIRDWPAWSPKAADNENVGRAAEQSVYQFVLGKLTWETDARDNGDRPTRELIALLGAIDTWYRAAPAPKPTTGAEPSAAALSTFTDTVPYWAPNPKKKKGPNRDDRPELIRRAVECYLRKRELVPLPTAVTDAGSNEVLAYLEFRADCRETADRIVLNAGGTCVGGYDVSATKGVRAIDIRPGMYAYYSTEPLGGLSHTMLVSDVFWDAAGQPTKLRIAESNKGGGWGHPGGMVPWKRRVWRDRLVVIAAQDANRRMFDAAGERYYLVVNPVPR